MSGHSKWHSIRHKKGAADAARGKVFTRHAKLIAIAARQGADADMNPGLRLAIENAKKENMPSANIERAVKKGAGLDKDGAHFMEIVYEGYAPGGVAILVSTLTDNKNRTVSSIRSTFSKNGGSMAESGSVAFLFEKKGSIIASPLSEDAEMIAIEAGAQDILLEGNQTQILTDPKDLFSIKSQLEEAGVEIFSAETALTPSTTVAVESESSARKIIHLIQLLEDNDDVSEVSTNADIPEDIVEKCME